MKFGLKQHIASVIPMNILRKPMRTLHLSLLFMLSLNLVSCRTPGSKDSDVQHEFGKTRRDVDGIVYLKCEQGQDPLALYVRDLAIHIAQANPELFTGEKSIDKFCFSVAEYGKLAEAFPLSRLVIVHRKWLWMAENDAEIASTLSHEIAHVLLSHIKGSTLEVEEEADEVGYEIFLRAQLNPESFRKGTMKMLATFDGLERIKKCIEDLNRGIVAEIGDSSHPSACYRLANIEKLENEAHLKDYAPLREKAVLLEVPALSGRLKAVHEILFPIYKKLKRDVIP